jgi:hypothetical protein
MKFQTLDQKDHPADVLCLASSCALYASSIGRRFPRVAPAATPVLLPLVP